MQKMKTLVIYYSYEGNTKLVAETIAKSTNAELLKLKPIEDYTTTGFVKYLWLGKEVMMRSTPELEKINIKIEEYDLIFIWTPIWAFDMTPPLRTFLKENKIKDKKIVLFCTSEWSKWRCFANIEKMIPDNNFLWEKEFVKVLKNKEKIKLEVSDWAIDFIK